MKHDRLRRSLGTADAILLGLGSIVGTGVFLSLGIATDVALSLVLPALVGAAVLALLNGLSSAQLAAAHPVSGGSYSYGTKYLGPLHGFAAGWMFLCAKSASAATAALTLAGSILALLELAGMALPESMQVLLGLAAVWGTTALTLVGIEKTARANALIVGITMLSLLVFAASCFMAVRGLGLQALAGRLTEIPEASPLRAALHASALLFVAFTGYGRIATLGEEVRDPKRTIPRAILWSVAAVLVLYLVVAAAAILAVGPQAFGELAVETAAPLPGISRAIGNPTVALLVSVGAVTALLSVILNLVLGLSRVALAMGRAGDLPPAFSRIRAGVPRASVIGVAVLISVLVLVGNVKTTWSFSAFTVLIYYGITHWSALAMPDAERLYPRWTAWIGLAGCLFLAFQVPAEVWASGCAVLGIGIAARTAYRAIARG